MTGQPRPQLRSKVRIRRRHPTAGPIEPAWGARTSAYQQLSPRRAASGKDSTMRNASHTTGWEPPPTRSTHRRNGYTSRPVEADVAYRSPRAARALGFECRQPAERVLPAARLWDARARLEGFEQGAGVQRHQGDMVRAPASSEWCLIGVDSRPAARARTASRPRRDRHRPRVHRDGLRTPERVRVAASASPAVARVGRPFGPPQRAAAVRAHGADRRRHGVSGPRRPDPQLRLRQDWPSSARGRRCATVAPSATQLGP